MIDLAKVLQEKNDLLDRQLAEAKFTRDHAPTRMEARYDAQRPEADQIVEALEKEIRNLKKFRQDQKKLPPFKGVAAVNVLVTLRTPLGTKNFLLVPEGLGGQTIGDTFLLSIASPLAQAFIDRKVGFTFTFNGGTYQIVFLNPNI